MKKTITRLAVAALGAGLIATGATAATPEAGSVSKGAPTVKWTGDTNQSYLLLNPMGNAASEVPCDGSACDIYTLDVAEDAPNLEIAVNVDDDDATAGIRIERPDGTVEYESGDSNTKTAFKFKIKDVKKGSHQIGVVTNFIDTITYKAQATLLFGAADAPNAPVEPGPAPTPTPAPSPQQGSGQPPAQQTAPTPKVTVAAGKASAKKLKKAKKFAMKVSTDQPLTAVTAEILKGKRRVGSAKLARLEGTKAITVKLKKGLKKGSYVLRVVGTDAQNRRAQAQAKLAVSK